MIIDLNFMGQPLLYRFRKYADPVMHNLGYDLGHIMEGNPNPSNFAYINGYIPGLGQTNNSSFALLTLADVGLLKSFQYANGGKTTEQIMRWFCGDGDASGRPYWYHTSSEIRWGVLFYANALVTIDRIETMWVKVPNSGSMANMEMGRVIPFTRADTKVPIQELLKTGKLQQASAVRGLDNIHTDTPDGAVMYSPLWALGKPSEGGWDVHPIPRDPATGQERSNFKRELWLYMATVVKEPQW